MKIRLGKVLANGGLSFFTSLAGIGTATELLQVDLPIVTYFSVALIIAGIQAGISIFKELCSEYDIVEMKKRKKKGLCSFTPNRWLEYLTVF